MEHGLWTLIQLSLAGSLLALAVLAVTRLFRGKISRTGATTCGCWSSCGSSCLWACRGSS